MKIEKVKIQVGITKQLKQYEPLKLDIGLEASIEDGENYKEVYSKLWDICSEEIVKELNELAEIKKAMDSIK